MDEIDGHALRCQWIAEEMRQYLSRQNERSKRNAENGETPSGD